MPYRELTMIDVKEVLRRWSAGHGDRRIGRDAGGGRKTVARYTHAAERLGLSRGAEGTDEGVHGVAQYLQSRTMLEPGGEQADGALRRQRMQHWLAGHG